MAELGSINTTDTNRGVSPVTKEGDLAALNAGLNLTGKVITEAAKTDIRNDLAEDAKDAIAASDAALDTPVEYDPLTKEALTESGVDLSGVDRDAVVNFTNEMRRHQALATQSKDSATRTRATQQMQRSLQAAKMKYPWLRDELQSEASQFISSSADLTELGLRDAAVNATNASGVNTDYIDSIKKKAYGEGDLGLKMDPRIEFGTAEFAVQYDRRTQRQQARVQLAEDVALFNAIDDKNARRAADITRRQLLAPEGDVMTMYTDLNRLIDPIQAVREAHAGGTATRGQLAEAEDNWQRVTVPHISRTLDKTIISMQTEFNKVWAGNLADEPQAEAARTMLNNSIENIKMVKASLAGDVRDVKMMLDTISHIATTKKLDDAPALRDLNDFLIGTDTNMIDALDKWQVTNKNSMDLDQAAEGLFEDMEMVYPNIFVSATEVKGMDEFAARAERKHNRSIGRPGRRVQGGTDIQILKDAFGMVENVLSEATNDRLNTPQHASAGLVTVAKYIEDTGTINRPLHVDEKQRMRGHLADDAMVALVDNVGKESSEVQQVRMAYEIDYFGLDGKDDRKQWADDVSELARTRIAQGPAENTPGFALLNLVDYDETTVSEDGSLAFSVSIPRVREAVRLANPNMVPGRDGSLFALEEKAIREANAAAAKLSEQVTTFTRSQAHLEYMRNPTSKQPQYLQAFMDVGAESAGMNTIFNIFRIQ